MDKNKILQTVFGHQKFRDFQEKAIDAVLEKKDLLTIIPTGGGKSLCYQLPSLLMDGLTVVISPLIALMQDQVIALQNNNINAQMINSSLSQIEAQEVFEDIKKGDVKLLYVAPERFTAYGFIDFLKTININFFVIDEAHCVSEWGHEFRADYQKLSLLKQIFPDTPVVAFTATATKKVQEGIISSLTLNNPVVLRGVTKRENIFISATKRVGNGRTQLIEFLKDKKEQTGIVYAFTRKETEQVAMFLQSKGFSAKAYHAGLNNSIREEVYTQFLNDKINIVVATIAFGMGIDKSNIRFVAHTSMPKTIENFYQEIGRAGRDGLESKTLLLYTKGDEISRLAMMDDITNMEYKNILTKKLNSMYQFANSSNCRHKFIANYFGDEIEVCKTKCDNCTKEKTSQMYITKDAQKLLSTIYRTNQSFGQNHIIDILRGSNNKKILQFNHNELSVYGIGEDKSKHNWEAIVDKLFDIEALSLGEYRALKLTNIGFDILKGKNEVLIDIDKIGDIEIKDEKEISSKEYSQFFVLFKELRTKIAHEEQVPPYVIFSDKTLVEISDTLPLSKEEMLKINGVGEVKFEKYGEQFLELCQTLKPQQLPKLTKTYLDTLDLIEDNKTIQDIANTRQLQPTSIIAHLELLLKHNKIVQEQYDNLTLPLKQEFPNDLKQWCEDGLKTYDMKILRVNLALYDKLFLDKELEKK